MITEDTDVKTNISKSVILAISGSVFLSLMALFAKLASTTFMQFFMQSPTEICDSYIIIVQPWPFPDSLMLGFTANYVSGSIHLDKNEIEFADWFDKNNLPVLPCKTSVARYLIEQHLKHFCSSSC